MKSFFLSGYGCSIRVKDTRLIFSQGVHAFSKEREVIETSVRPCKDCFGFLDYLEFFSLSLIFSAFSLFSVSVVLFMLLQMFRCRKFQITFITLCLIVVCFFAKQSHNLLIIRRIIKDVSFLFLYISFISIFSLCSLGIPSLFSCLYLAF